MHVFTASATEVAPTICSIVFVRWRNAKKTREVDLRRQSQKVSKTDSIDEGGAKPPPLDVGSPCRARSKIGQRTSGHPAPPRATGAAAPCAAVNGVAIVNDSRRRGRFLPVPARSVAPHAPCISPSAPSVCNQQSPLLVRGLPCPKATMMHARLPIRACQGKFFIELFAGTARLSKALSSCGVSSLPIDVRFGVSHDVSQPSVRKWICDLLRSGCCIGLWIAIPCTTLSRARDRNRLTRVRGNEGRDLFGLPDLTPEQRSLVTSANRIINFCVALCRLANSLSIPWYIENPRTSKLWLLPCIVALETPRTTCILDVDFCQYGTPGRRLHVSWFLVTMILQHFLVVVLSLTLSICVRTLENGIYASQDLMPLGSHSRSEPSLIHCPSAAPSPSRSRTIVWTCGCPAEHFCESGFGCLGLSFSYRSFGIYCCTALHALHHSTASSPPGKQSL